MKKWYLTIIFFFTIVWTSVAQNYIYKGDRQYKATETWQCQFIRKGVPDIASLDVTIAKHQNGGYLMLAIDDDFNIEYIGGIVRVFLSDGTIIKCTDRGIHDHVNNTSISLYNFTQSEIERLKQHRITAIRFSIMGIGPYGSSYAVDSNYDTEEEVRKLFGE